MPVDVKYANRSIGQHLGKVKSATETIKKFVQSNVNNEVLDEAGQKIATNVDKDLDEELTKLKAKWSIFEDGLEQEDETAFNGLEDMQVDSELTRKLLLGVFEKKVPKLMISSRQSLYEQNDSEKEESDGDSQRKKLSSSSYHSAENADGK